MKRIVRIIALLVVALAAIWSMPPGMRAQSNNQAALVIRHGDNEVKSICVDFEEAQISGYELLQRSGADLEIGAQGLGSLICSIDSTGCPASDCLCQCKGGGECIYWSYWHRLNEKWQYSQGGASVYMVEPGAVEGWSWGPGAVNQAVPPPDISFDEVCQAEPTNTPTPSPTATITQPPIIISPAATATKDASSAATATILTNTATSTTAATATATQNATFTPSPLPSPSTEPTITVENISSQQVTVPPTAAAVEQPPQTVPEPERVRVETTVMSTPLTIVDEATVTPGPVAIAMNAKTGSAESIPDQGSQIIVESTAEPTVPLAVIGEGVVPTTSAEIDGLNSVDRDSRGTGGSDSSSYLAFLAIIAGLVGLLWFISLRRRRQKHL